jgi:NADPH:quinone reductase-like Zn-dependent oxidoreductase
MPPRLTRFGVTAIVFIDQTNSEEPAKLAETADDSALHVTISRTFPLADGRAADKSRSAPDRKPGKTVLTVRD